MKLQQYFQQIQNYEKTELHRQCQRWFQLCVNTESGHSWQNWKKTRKCFSFYYNCYSCFIISIIYNNLIMIFLQAYDNLQICLYALSVNDWTMRTDTAAIGYAYSAGRFRFRLWFQESAPVGAKNVPCLTVQVRIVVAGSGGSVETVYWNDFLILVPTLGIVVGIWICLHYALCADWRWLSESELEPESACTIRFTPTGANSRNRSQNLNLPAIYAYPFSVLHVDSSSFR
jgi:hypothetical protein